MVIDCMSDKAPESGPLGPIRGFHARVDAMAPFFSHIFLKPCCHVVVLTMTSLVFFSSCVHSPDVPSQFDANIKTAEDVNQLKKLDINSISHIFILELSNGKGAVELSSDD
jgi:hypothetical protein